MAIQKGSLASIEHDWYATRSGLPTQATLTQHKETYYISKGFGGTGKPVTQMEEEWLLSVAARDCGGTYDLWVGACQAQSATVGKSIDECRFNFFNKVTTSP